MAIVIIGALIIRLTLGMLGSGGSAITVPVLTDQGGGADKPMGIFTGDFVFVGSIGRPDLLEQAAGIANTAEPGARDLFKSAEQFKQLPEYLQVWPAHGAGSACGKGLGAIPSST